MVVQCPLLIGVIVDEFAPKSPGERYLDTFNILLYLYQRSKMKNSALDSLLSLGVASAVITRESAVSDYS